MTNCPTCGSPKPELHEVTREVLLSQSATRKLLSLLGATILALVTIACGGDGFESAAATGGAAGAAGAAADGGAGGQAGAGGSGGLPTGGSSGATGGASGASGGQAGSGGGTPTCTMQQAYQRDYLPAMITWSSWSYAADGACVKCDDAPCSVHQIEYPWEVTPPSWPEPDVVTIGGVAKDKETVALRTGCSTQSPMACFYAITVSPSGWLRLHPEGNGYRSTIELWSLSVGGESTMSCDNALPAPPDQWSVASLNALDAEVKEQFDGLYFPCE